MALRVRDLGASFTVSVDAPEIRGFRLGWPDSGLDELLGLKLRFDKASGKRFGLWIKGECDATRVNRVALLALVHGMRDYAFAHLGIRVPGAAVPRGKGNNSRCPTKKR